MRCYVTLLLYFPLFVFVSLPFFCKTTIIANYNRCNVNLCILYVYGFAGNTSNFSFLKSCNFVTAVIFMPVDSSLYKQFLLLSDFGFFFPPTIWKLCDHKWSWVTLCIDRSIVHCAPQDIICFNHRWSKGEQSSNDTASS